MSDWLDAGNDLLSKCHINLRMQNISDCSASVFVSLYQAILGEEVPDYIAVPRSQEDDSHNVQSVIDSLALDYLQISLSHITGENIVRGNKESIKNLLDIFEGLLEYLTEQISETSSQSGDDPDPREKDPVVPGALWEDLEDQHKEAHPAAKPSSPRGSSQSSLPSWDAEGSESTTELIRLGDSAHTFITKQDTRKGDASHFGSRLSAEWTNGNEAGASSSGPGPAPRNRREPEPTTPLPSTSVSLDPLDASATQLGHPIRQAIPLQPPYQPPQHRPDPWSSQPPGPGDEEPAPPVQTIPGPSRAVSDSTAVNGTQSRLSPESEKSSSSSSRSAAHKKPGPAVERERAKESSISAPKRVVFRTQPDVRLLSLQGGLEESGVCSSEEGDPTNRLNRSSQWDHRAPQERTLINDSSLYDDGVVEPLSRRRVRNKLAEQELQEMSAKLSRRLEELDSMLKQALGETGGASEVRGEEDKLSHHSDSFMECRRTKKQSGRREQNSTSSSCHIAGTPHPKKTPRTRSLSPSPPRARRTLQGQFEDTVPRDQMQRVRREVQRELDLQRRKAGIVGRAYEDVLKSYKGKERIQISKEKAKAKETEQEYKENLYKDALRTPKRSRIPPAKPTPHTPRASQETPARGVVRLSKALPMKIKDNDLLPLLLEEFPCLHVSPHALNKMWKQQFRQMEQLTGSVSEQEQERSRAKLNTEVEEAQRKYELLVEIIRKEQEHNQRLKDFKDRIRQQKSAQSRMREQRQQVARAKKYYNDYHVQLRARMLRSRTREERIFKNLFEEGLAIQKKRVRELRSYARDQREEHKKKHKEELESMENYYKDQFSMLAETLAQEQQEIQVRKKAQEKALQKMKKELRGKMEREIGELQEMIMQNDDDVYFRELEAERLSRRVHMASFQYGTSHLL
ncbi:centrosomal protein of 95 kDa-like isoform X2 [Polyodon spathula]|uniref:centrosomal protein of 95 kDa-like isoform X2 n=1 Tax=Polyodon spathula TaxID=7913 RepID=UPI001B7F1579|nr:centrosomal protein of 95 kDa-like isoform X2 [Polyodon spathula]